MPCKNCGSPAVGMTDQDGGTNGGAFFEEYQCHDCGAIGCITGESSDPPNEWNRSGLVF